jgi:hypothetical protein
MSEIFKKILTIIPARNQAGCCQNFLKFLVFAALFSLLLLYNITLNETYNQMSNQRAKLDLKKFNFVYKFISNENSKKLKEEEIKGWPRGVSRIPRDYILPYQSVEVLKFSNICPSTTDPLFILIVVSSTAENFKDRQTVRDTWGNTTKFNYPMFQKMHGKNTGHYLDPNYEDWRKYAAVSV